MKHFYTTAALFLILSALGGCMSEDMDDCPLDDNLILRLSYQGETRAFADRIQDVGVFMFDNEDRFVLSAFLDREHLLRSATVELSVEPGEYSIVCWGNIETSRTSPGPAEIVLMNGEEAYYAPRQTAANPYDSDSYETFAVTVPKSGVVERTIEFMAAHRTVSVYVKGMTDKDASGVNLPPVVELTGIPSGYDYRFTLFPETRTYTRTAAYSDDIAGAVFNTPLFRIDDNTDIVVRKQTDNSVLHSVNLQEFLLSEGIVPSMSDPVEIMIEFMDGSVEITLPDWNGNDVKPEF